MVAMIDRVLMNVAMWLLFSLGALLFSLGALWLIRLTWRWRRRKPRVTLPALFARVLRWIAVRMMAHACCFEEYLVRYRHKKGRLTSFFFPSEATDAGHELTPLEYFEWKKGLVEPDPMGEVGESPAPPRTHEYRSSLND
jgi:hypothetical protein